MNLIDKLMGESWKIFSTFNGNPETHNIGVYLSICLILSLILVVVLQLRTKMIFDKKHLVAFVGVIALLFRVVTLFVFEWGWQIGLYNDSIIHFLSPPLEHFWNMLFLLCLSYYTLVTFDYFPGVLKRIIKYIPIFLVGFFVYTVVIWKMEFVTNLPQITQYFECASDWLTHFLIFIISAYTFGIAIVKYKKYHKYISAFWTIIMIDNAIRAYIDFIEYKSYTILTIMNSFELIALMLLIFHFVDIYIPRNPYPIVNRRNTNSIICKECLKKILVDKRVNDLEDTTDV